MSRVVLITGCSSGIGRDLAQYLAGPEYTVIATARKVETLAELPAALKLPLDVTDVESINKAVESTLEHFGRIDALVNNAGYAIQGAVEEVSIEGTQQMFDTNVIGVIRMVQAVLPTMRRQKAGRIINVSSIAGKLATPVNGTYSATKFALEGLCDALRIELAPFGIQVVLVEPGSIQTHFAETVKASTQYIFSNTASPYRELYEKYNQVTAGMRRNAPGPRAVSKVIKRAIEAATPKVRYLAGVPLSGKLVLALGGSAWDRIAAQLFKFDTVRE